MPRFICLLAALALSSCASSQCSPRGTATAAPVDAGPTAETTAAPIVVADAAEAQSPPVAAKDAPTPVAEPTAHAKYIEWIRSQLPPGGEVVDSEDARAPAQVFHVVHKDENAQAIAKAYIAVSDVYFADDFATEIAKAARRANVSIRAGAKIPIPHIVLEAPKSADDERLASTDAPVRGLYIRGATAVRPMFLFILDQMVKRDINAIVLDAKDYDGPVTYPSKVPLVVETGAAKGAPIRDLARVIRFVHKRGIRVIMRVSCFNDELMSKAKPKLSVQSKWGKPYPLGWLDPTNEEAQNYILALVAESVEAGADEIQLDYVRFPVLGTKGADFHLEERNLVRTNVIRDFVRRAHAITQARKVPLSLDVFGVIAQGRRIDIDALGQDLAILAPEVEALSPMVYPSHYSVGFYGWQNPGDHPEIVGIGVKGSLEQIKASPKGVPLAVIRPWIQAMNYKTTNYGPHYLSEEIRTGDLNGATGWLMWNPTQEYGPAWAAVPPKPATTASTDKHPTR